MTLPVVNYLHVLVGGVIVFILGGLWYSPVLFAKRWVALMGKSEEELRAAAAGAGPLMYVKALFCGLVISYVMAIMVRHFGGYDAMRGAEIGLLCWGGFAATTSYATAVFSMQPKALWLINSGYNLVSFVLVAVLHSLWW